MAAAIAIFIILLMFYFAASFEKKRQLHLLPIEFICF
jgi:hypothetical protein